MAASQVAQHEAVKRNMQPPDHKSSKLVPTIVTVFGELRRGTPMALIQWAFPSAKDNDPFIDTYVLLLPIVPLIFLAAYGVPLLHYLLFLLFAWRLFEVIVFLSNTYLFDDYRARMRGETPRPFGGIQRVLILTAVNYMELILWFAAAYRILIPQLSHRGIEPAVEALNFSFVVMSAFGSSKVQPNNWWITLLSLFQSALGLAMALAVIARSVSLLPTRRTGDPFEVLDDDDHSS